jgi:MFS family permease
LQREFGASRGEVSFVFSLAGFLNYSLGIVTGPLADRWSSRSLAITGMLLTGGGLVLASFADSLLQVYLAYGLGVGVGMGCAYVPAIGAVQRWFVRRRGFASGLAVSGIGIGTLMVPPLAEFLIHRLGWREAYLVIGCVTAIAGAGLSFLIDNDPGRRGLAPDGDPVGAGAPTPTPARGLSVREAVRSKRFVGLYSACLIGSFGLFVPVVHLVPYAVQHGVSQPVAVLLVSAMGVGSTAGRLFLGGLADRMGRRAALPLMFIGMGVSFVVWAASAHASSLAFSAFLFGVFYGGFVALAPALVADSFGGRNVSGIIGILYTSVAVGTLVGPSAAGFAFDASGSYSLPILASAATNFLAAIILVMATRKTANFL